MNFDIDIWYFSSSWPYTGHVWRSNLSYNLRRRPHCNKSLITTRTHQEMR